MSQVKEKFLKDYTPSAFHITQVELDFVILPEHTDVVSILHITKQTDAKDLELDTEELELLEIYLNDLSLQEPRYAIKEKKLIIYNVPENFTITIKNRLYPQNNTELEGLYKSGDILCTQCEPEGFRRITPFIDRPDIMARYTTIITAEKTIFPVLLSNGNLIAKEEIGTKLSVTWEDPFPKPSYLFALVAGDLGSISDSFTTKSGKKVDLHIYTDKGNEKRCFYAMQSLKKAMQWDEEKYDREYDLDIYNIVAVDSFNMGAMENKGLNIFNSAYVLADSEVATDRDFMGIESVIAHEYFHNWTGNRITCRDWFQLTLKEGLTVFRDQCFSADMNSKLIQRIEDVQALRERQFVEDASPMRHPIQPKSYISMNNFYTATVYEKGAEVIRMLHTLLGEEKFYQAMQIYFERFDGKAVTTDDFLACMQEAGGVDLSQFKLWYDQSGTPKLHIKESYNEEEFCVTFTQEIPKTLDGKEQKAMFYPLNIALFSDDGTLLEEKQLIISQQKQSISFGKFSTKPHLSVNRNFSAPIITLQDEVDHSFLAQYETDGFSRFEAHQKAAKEVIFTIKEEGVVAESYLNLYETLLESDEDLMFQSLLLEIPSLADIINTEEKINIQVFHNARETLLQTLAKRFEQKLKTIYTTHHHPEDTTITKEAKAARAIKNYALELLSYLSSQEVLELAQRQYYESANMTDRLQALAVADRIDATVAKAMFEDFYKHYHTNSLLMVKYFALLMAKDDVSVFERIEFLRNDRAFDIKVPNLVRGLYGGFTRNLNHFHTPKGYELIGEFIMELDSLNPQIASNLANSFRLYPKLQEENQKVIKEVLEKVLQKEDLSSNTYEVVSKIIKG